jgi:Leucine-rich repeat (LRR) protein
LARPRRSRKSPDEVYAEAVEQIENARNRRTPRLNLGKGRRAFERLPPLDDLPFLTELSLEGTGVSDLSPLGALTNLQLLSLGNAPVTEFGPLSGLRQLDVLTVGQSKAHDWRAFASLENLTVLEFETTAVTDIEPIAGLKKLRRFMLGESSVSDIGPIAKLKGLESLWIQDCPIADLTPISELGRLKELSLEKLHNSVGIEPLPLPPNIESMQITGQDVVNLSSVTSLENLERLVVTYCERVKLPDSLEALKKLRTVSFYSTNVSDLSFLSSCLGLETLVVRHTPVRDLSPILNLTKLEDLGLDRSKVSDLSPIAGLISLVKGAKRANYEGVSFSGCPIRDSTLLELAETSNPRRTIETLNYLRSKQGLPPIDEFVEPNEIADWRSRALQLRQSPLGVRFEPAEDFFEISASGQPSDEEAGDHRITRQLHEQVKIKSSELVARAARLANTVEWQSLSHVSARFDELIQTNIENVSEHVGLVWAQLVSLGSFLEQDDDARQSPSAFSSQLDADIRRPLLDLLQTAGPWVRRFPSARELDEDHANFQTPRHAVEPALQILTTADDEAVIEGEDAQILEDALLAGGKSGVQSLKARSWGVLSVRNLIVGAMGVAAVGVASGASKQVGIEVARRSILAQKSIQLILSSEDALVQFLSSLPADIRSTVRALLDDLKNRNSQPEFPLPFPPREARTPIRQRKRDN